MDISNWSAERWIAVVAIIVAVVSALSTFWQAAEARGAKKVASRASVDSKRSADAAEASASASQRSADAAELSVTVSQEAASHAQRSVEIEADREHSIRRDAITLKRTEVRNNQRVAVLRNTGSRLIKLGADVVFPTGARSNRKHYEELHPGATLDIWLDGREVKIDFLEVSVNGECPCSRAESNEAHWLVRFEISDLPGPARSVSG